LTIVRVETNSTETINCILVHQGYTKQFNLSIQRLVCANVGLTPNLSLYYIILYTCTTLELIS